MQQPLISLAKILKKDHTYIFLIISLGLLIRVMRLGPLEFWYDEAFSGVLSFARQEEFLSTLQNETNPPLYYFILKAWAAVFGHSQFALQSLSLVLGLSTVFLIYLVCLRIFNKQVAHIAAFLAAVNPFLIEYSMEARTYALFGFLALLALYFVISRNNIGFIIVSAFLAFSHFVALFYGGILLLAVLYFGFKEKKILISILTVLASVVFFVSAYNYAVHRTGGARGHSWVERAKITNLTKSIGSYAYGVKSKLPGNSQINDVNLLILDQNHLTGIITILFVIGLMVSVFESFDKKDRSKIEMLILLFALYIGPQLVLIAADIFKDVNIYVERYLFPSSVFFVILCGVFLTDVFKPKYRWTAAAIYALTTVFIVTPDYYRGMRELSSKYKNIPNEVVFTSPADYGIGRYYFMDSQNIRLYDPKNPDERFPQWLLIRPDSAPTNLEAAYVISPDPERLTPRYEKVEDIGSYGVYRLAR